MRSLAAALLAAGPGGRAAVLGPADRVADRLGGAAGRRPGTARPGGVRPRRPRDRRHGRRRRLLRAARRRRLRRLGLRPGRHRPLVAAGHSWGAQVAAAYLAAHPGHVAKVVFSSPGALAPAVDDGSGGRVRARLDRGQQLRLYRLLARPRVLLVWTLLQLNYLSWSSGLAYLRAVPGSRLAYLHHAGHNSYQDQPAAFLATVRAFLAGRPLPEPLRTGSGVPADYEGPP